jgi:hypothetical protein
VLLVLVSGVTTGCGGSGDGWYGAITSLHPLCVGRHAASGDCFEGASSATMSSLTVGECVQVTFRSSASPVETQTSGSSAGLTVEILCGVDLVGERAAVAGQAGWGGVEFLGEEFQGAGDAWAVGLVQGDDDLALGVVDLAA